MDRSQPFTGLCQQVFFPMFPTGPGEPTCTTRDAILHSFLSRPVVTPRRHAPSCHAPSCHAPSRLSRYRLWPSMVITLFLSWCWSDFVLQGQFRLVTNSGLLALRSGSLLCSELHEKIYLLLSAFGGRKAPSSMGKISTAEAPSATLRTGSSTPRHKRCAARSIGEALRSG
jgi:hypothetical protein